MTWLITGDFKTGASAPAAASKFALDILAGLARVPVFIDDGAFRCQECPLPIDLERGSLGDDGCLDAAETEQSDRHWSDIGTLARLMCWLSAS